jgi:hypothetical protein
MPAASVDVILGGGEKVAVMPWHVVRTEGDDAPDDTWGDIDAAQAPSMR